MAVCVFGDLLKFVCEFWVEAWIEAVFTVYMVYNVVADVFEVDLFVFYKGVWIEEYHATDNIRVREVEKNCW